MCSEGSKIPKKSKNFETDLDVCDYRENPRTGWTQGFGHWVLQTDNLLQFDGPCLRFSSCDLILASCLRTVLSTAEQERKKERERERERDLENLVFFKKLFSVIWPQRCFCLFFTIAEIRFDTIVDEICLQFDPTCCLQAQKSSKRQLWCFTPAIKFEGGTTLQQQHTHICNTWFFHWKISAKKDCCTRLWVCF